MTIKSRQIFIPQVMNIFALFGNTDSFYQVPQYQREYNWMDKQVEELWDDINNAKESDYDRYFLGPIILIKKEGKKFYEVVDGQQRLTTLTIFFSVIKDLYATQFEEGKFKVTLNKIKQSLFDSIGETYRLRLITQLRVRNQFEREVLNSIEYLGDNASEKTKEQNKFKNTAQIFKEKLKELETTDGVEAIADLLVYIFDNVEVITITCSNSDYAINLFEVLNTRGLELSNADLVKTFLYSKCMDEKKDQFITTWSYIENLTEDLDENMTDLLTYYQHYLLARNPRYSVYVELKKEFNGKDPNIVVYDFKKMSDFYDEILALNSKEIFALKYIPNQVYWKAILVTAKMVGFQEFDSLCNLLRNFYYCYWIAGYTITKIKQTSFNIIAWIKDGLSLKEIDQKLMNKMISDKVFKNIQEVLDEDVQNYSWIKPVLLVVEYHQTDDSKLVFVEKDKKLHLEHILPIEWEKEKYWVDRWNTEDANLWVGKLGNLTLLSGSKNIIAQNFSFDEKKSIYQGKLKSSTGLTAFIISQYISKESDWTKNEVLQRTLWLKKEIKKILGIPEKQNNTSKTEIDTDLSLNELNEYTELFFPYEHVNKIISRYIERSEREVKLHCHNLLKSKTISFILKLEAILKTKNLRTIKEEIVDDCIQFDADLKNKSQEEEEDFEPILTKGRLRNFIRDINDNLMIEAGSSEKILIYLEKWLGYHIRSAINIMRTTEPSRKTLLIRDFL